MSNTVRGPGCVETSSAKALEAGPSLVSFKGKLKIKASFKAVSHIQRSTAMKGGHIEGHIEPKHLIIHPIDEHF